MNVSNFIEMYKCDARNCYIFIKDLEFTDAEELFQEMNKENLEPYEKMDILNDNVIHGKNHISLIDSLDYIGKIPKEEKNTLFMDSYIKFVINFFIHKKKIISTLSKFLMENVLIPIIKKDFADAGILNDSEYLETFLEHLRELYIKAVQIRDEPDYRINYNQFFNMLEGYTPNMELIEEFKINEINREIKSKYLKKVTFENIQDITYFLTHEKCKAEYDIFNLLNDEILFILSFEEILVLLKVFQSRNIIPRYRCMQIFEKIIEKRPEYIDVLSENDLERFQKYYISPICGDYSGNLYEILNILCKYVPKYRDQKRKIKERVLFLNNGIETIPAKQREIDAKRKEKERITSFSYSDDSDSDLDF